MTACGQIMVGSGTDTYDPVCELPAGHGGPCKSTAAIDQHRLAELWRCRHCGKWSHAKRRPSSHQRLEVLADEPGEYRRTIMVHCGPFDRYVADRNDPAPPPPLGGDGSMLGLHIVGTEHEWHADPDAGFDQDVPF